MDETGFRQKQSNIYTCTQLQAKINSQT